MIRPKNDNMKTFLRSFVVLVVLFLGTTVQSQAQLTDILKQIIIAADIAVQKAQNATIGLQNAQKEIENELSKLQLGAIGDWEQKIRDLYSEYFQELWQVKDAITDFRAITGIIQQQQQLVSEYKQAYQLLQQDKHFSPAELDYMSRVYGGIIAESVKSLDEIVTLLTSFSLQMTDAARLRIIRQAAADIERDTGDLRNFNSQAIQLSLGRAKTEADLATVRSLYGLPQ